MARQFNNQIMPESVPHTVPPVPAQPAPRPVTMTIEKLRNGQAILEKYKSGKANLDRKLVENEDWWKLNHYRDFRHMYVKDADTGKVGIAADHPKFKKQSSWMFNSIMNKHADLMDNYPDPVIMARAQDDESAAKTLSAIVPVVLDHCHFEQVYSDNSWDKLLSGASIYGVTWNADLLNGLGDIEVTPVDMLTFYWEPGVQNIQESQNIFVLSLMDNKVLEDTYPQTRDRITGTVQQEKRYNYDDNVDTTDKSLIVDWYFKTQTGGRTILHYCKYVDDIVLYCSDDDPEHPEYAETGFYDHGKYPFVMDSLFREKGTPAGFGYIDVMKATQEYIDSLGADILENAKWGAKPRYFAKDEGGVNLQEFRNLDQQIVHVAGGIDEMHLRPIDHKSLDGIYLQVYQAKIDELKETSGNRDFSQGSTSSGVTSGSAIAALQEAGSKGSRDMIKGSYRAFSEICELVIELIRQFYDTPRAFRITGETGQPEYVEFDNASLQGRTYEMMGQEFSTKEPVFDIIVKAQKNNPYSRLSQNELALQFYNLGFFNPQLTDQALATIDMMDFDGKDKVKQKIQENGTMYQQLQQMQQTMNEMAQLLANTTGDTRIMDALAAQQGEEPAPTISGGSEIAQTDNMGNPVQGNTAADKMRRRINNSTEVR